MKQPKRILALLGAVLLAGMYVCTLVFALMKSELAQTLFRASLGCTILVPVLLYAFLLAARMLRPAKSPLVDNVIFDLGNVLKDHFFIRFHIRDLLIHITIIGMLRAHPAEPGAVIIEPDHGDTLPGSHLFQFIPDVRKGILRQRLRNAAGPAGIFIFQPVVQMGIIVIWSFVPLPGADRHIIRRKVILIIGDSPSGDSVVREVAQIKIHVAYPCSHLRSANRDRLLPDLHLCSFLSGSLHRHDHTVIGTIETSVRIRNINRILAVIQVLQDHSFRFRTRHTGSKRKR